jgi:large subunit ribosomal protein L15
MDKPLGGNVSMPHRLRKVRKQRGSRTHGWGQVGQHRGIGMRGGRGKAGRKKHKWTYVLKYEPNYFGKHGFQRSWANRPTTMNVGELDTQIEELMTNGVIQQEDTGYHINLDELGIGKLLGSGRVTKPLQITVKSWSATAAQKIEAAGGQILAVDQPPEI